MSQLGNAARAQDHTGALFGKAHSSLPTAKLAVMETFAKMIADPQVNMDEGENNGETIRAVYSIIEMKSALSQYEQKFMSLMSVK